MTAGKDPPGINLGIKGVAGEAICRFQGVGCKVLAGGRHLRIAKGWKAQPRRTGLHRECTSMDRLCSPGGPPRMFASHSSMLVLPGAQLYMHQPKPLKTDAAIVRRTPGQYVPVSET